MTRTILLALVVAFLVGCSGTEVRDHAVVAREVQEDILELQEAISNGASQSEIDQRFRLLADKVGVLIDSAENYDGIMDRFRSLYDEFDEVSRTDSRPTSQGDAFFSERGIRVSPSSVRPVSSDAGTRAARRQEADLERTNRELREQAERDVEDELSGIIARAELAERRQLDTLGDDEEEDDE